MNPQNAIKILVAEYPLLSKFNPQIIKQFISSNNRIYNTFLVQSNKVGFKRFIAKSFVHHPDSLKKEWIVLKNLQDTHVPAPKLLIADHEPKNFLLLEFIEGLNAEEAINSGEDISEIFTKIGETVGKLHTIQAEYFGTILEPTSWEDYCNTKITETLPLLKSFVNADLYEKVTKMIEKTKGIVALESKGIPVLVHHDLYLDNFIIREGSHDAVLIDYGIALGGTPFFDLAKFYIWDLYRFPDQKEVFLKSYSRYIPLPDNFSDIMSFYIMRECFGMISFFHKINDTILRDNAIKGNYPIKPRGITSTFDIM